MKVSLNWLKRYIDIAIDPYVLAEKLTMAGLEVESVTRPGDRYQGFLIGAVIGAEKHPKADRLTVCRVDIGQEQLQIVCGAPNVAAGQKVVVGVAGAVVPRNQHDPEGKPFALSHVKLRGVDSYGMICSSFELDLGDDKEGIWVLPPDARTGTPLAQYLGLDDTILEIGITPNRPDAMSHIGIAREISALSGVPFRVPAAELKESGGLTADAIDIVIEDPVNAPRYSARILKNIRIGPSPAWLCKALECIGIRPVNNVVDVTNFVLMETGHPLHAFDYDLIRGKKIVVRSLQHADKFITLDGKERQLPAGTLMICDGSGPVAVAGVMGGLNSEISSGTTTVLIESAYFNSSAVRKSSKSLGLSTDASQRFERGADPSATVSALDRTAALLQEIADATVLEGVVDVYPKPINRRSIRLRLSKLNAILGSTISMERVVDLLRSIGIIPADPQQKAPEQADIEFLVPTFRPDLEREIDLIEEVARLNGFDNISVQTTAAIAISHEPLPEDISAKISSWLVGRGFNQVVANSMQSVGIASIGSADFISVLNPLSTDMAAMRTTLVTGMLQIISGNIRHGNKDLRLFEFGRVYFKNTGDQVHSPVPEFREEERLILALSGNSSPVWWDAEQRRVDFFDLKGELKALFLKFGLDKFQFIPYSTTNALTQDGLAIEIQGQAVGWLGEVAGEILKAFDIDQKVIVAEINIDACKNAMDLKRKFSPLAVYPSIIRDLAIVVNESLPMAELLREVQESAGALLVGMELFDIYRGDQVPDGSKSCALALEFRSPDRTLSQDDADRSVKAIMDHMSHKFKATLRA